MQTIERTARKASKRKKTTTGEASQHHPCYHREQKSKRNRVIAVMMAIVSVACVWPLFLMAQLCAADLLMN